ncbi:glycoside hydrolase family 73 protein [Bombilactobacillus thymidiniphilus]|uniref:Glycoside hydrolase family 73 protein n=1 Tax=Bombilactobacillus thymidiniphilus TaxID=2923363 RepID=A0ABY4PEC4_9LACO|nr:glycoside hydrolase family 73 protein [Bombilactobacillus thymidiniphilus]UQS83866.1 glycoside hydrolase family 73 protein [Bombilactobacillus thymidiniphilus]
MILKANKYQKILMLMLISGGSVGSLHHHEQVVYATTNNPLTIQVSDVADQQNTITSNGYGDTVFLNYLGLSAQKLANNNDVYASVMIAQALLESGWGTSSLAQAPNYNLFGVKGTYQEDSVDMSTQEDDGSGNLYTIQSNFRKYPSYKESLEDYVRVIRDNKIYKDAWKSNAASYKDATKCLTGKYATDTSYDQKLNSLIEKYDLTRFDQPLDWNQQTSSNDIIVNNINFATKTLNNPINLKGSYGDQQAPIIVLNNYQKNDESEDTASSVNNSLDDVIGYNEELTQPPVAKNSSSMKDKAYFSAKPKSDPVQNNDDYNSQSTITVTRDNNQ